MNQKNQNAKTTYNGWTNYETWAANLWLTNEHRTYAFWAERTREILADSPAHENQQAAVAALAAEISEAIHGECAIEKANLAADLMNAALSEIDWHEIAHSFIDDAITPDSPEPKRRIRFPLGRVVATPGSMEKLTDDDRVTSLARHSKGDWGDVSPEDHAENELSLTEGFRLLSVYRSKNGVKFWIITEADRSVTTILLPDEY